MYWNADPELYCLMVLPFLTILAPMEPAALPTLNLLTPGGTLVQVFVLVPEKTVTVDGLVTVMKA